MYLGLDLGTSGLKAILTDETGALRGTREASYANPHPHTGWSEQDPADWIAACETVLDGLAAGHPSDMAALKGIGLSGHMHGATLLGADDAVLRPCILWNDTRAAEEAAALDAAPGLREATGNIVFPGFTAPKLLWVERHEPEIWEKVAKVLLPKDYLRLWLTGEHLSDLSDSAGTAWLDVGARAWSDRALEAGHMTRAQMPGLVEGSAEGGRLRDALRARWGVTGPVVVAGGGGDNAAAACGAGCFAEGQGFVSLGTSGVLLSAKGGYAPDPASAVHTFCHAVPDTWYQMGVILSATDSLNWLARQTGRGAAELAGMLPERAEGPGDLLFLPYLSGERTPHNDAALRGALIGLDVAHDPAALTQAVVEGVCFAIRDCLEALRGTGTELTSVLAMGGGARSRFWLEAMASTLDLPLQVPAGGEFGAALGAARLGIAAATGGSPAEIMTPPPVGETIAPRADLVPRYAAAWERYRALVPAIRAAQAD
ncbi:xylulokinase [Jannaschia seohaensis]|uniref:Xylulose kinase n=1 Tax=Jannaschia seohaensis TaxID=475081 RepID=A0A2Y9ANG2_9RHOB|nr:xylulokinase [Jannaschia seohaensis]PWJ19402.1 xylulokinase [Jannaschia seohaensis]SSA46064.1 xylulokinase [Jannaschia seohaensis]